MQINNMWVLLAFLFYNISNFNINLKTINKKYIAMAFT